ncbi:MAG TPA: hypothetical protein VFZ26_10450 [Gemmatimonadales bacterium]
MTHTERVHVLFGAGLALLGLLAILAERRQNRLAATGWPILAFLIGLLLFIPVEAQTRTYTQVGWIELLRTIAPDRPATWIEDWLDKARAGHVVQHKIGGLVAMIAGLVELGLARGWLTSVGWRHVLPAALVTVGLAFGIHGGTSHHLPFRLEQSHHHLLGTGLVVAGVTLALSRAGVLRRRAWAMVWPVLALLAGLNLALFYRLPADSAPHAGHGPAAPPASPEAP